MFTKNDIQQIKNKGITLKQVTAQVARIKNGMSYSNLIAAATIGKGIETYNATETQAFIDFYQAKQNHLRIIKFVPASGAASRMFQFLFQFLNDFDAEKENIHNYMKRTNNTLIKTFISNVEAFPFYESVLAKAKATHPNFDGLSEDAMHVAFVKTMLGEDALNYSKFPKGLLPFHKYSNAVLTAFQEHVFESTLYATSNGQAHLHFTVSKKHHAYFISELNTFKTALETKTGLQFHITFSYQKETTEVLALTKDHRIFRHENGSILFRPAGHGALLENLNDLNQDLIFIKNIDNIVVETMNIKVSEHKKLLAGVLLKVQAQVFEFLNAMDCETVSEENLKTIIHFASHTLNIVFNEAFFGLSSEEKIAILKAKFNRPIRVCGMVKNEGEPGGGPFWVKDKNGNTSLQIVEFAQIDIRDEEQADCVKNATHFNPTDLVCGVKNYKGEAFNLLDFVNPEAAFITQKSKNGTDILALELPGLWNGSMAHWNSIFVEVPLETFNPVKTVNDLLKPPHQVT